MINFAKERIYIMQEKIIPQDISAEQSVLGAMLIDKTAVARMAETLQPDDFYRVSHQVIFRAMVNLYKENKPADMVTVVDELKKNGQLDSAEGISYITLLANSVPTAANVKYHANIVREKAFYRMMVEKGTDIASMGYACNGDVEQLLDATEKKLMRLANCKQDRAITPIQDLVTSSMDHINALMENEEAITGLSTGFTDLDNLTFGLQPSDFIILAARPSVGKTSLALNIAQNIALRGAKEGEAPKRVAYFSLEMSAVQLTNRMICTEAEVEMRELRGLPADRAEDAAEGEDPDSIRDRLWTSADKIAGASLFIDDTANLSIQELRSRARKLKADGGLDLIVIDYLQMMRASDFHPYSENRQYEVSRISRGLKALARELNVPVLALSQLSRNVETRQSKRPMLSDLRESGSLEQDADIVMFLYRDDSYKETDDEPTCLTELIVAKHRNGPTGAIDLYFENGCTKYIGLNDADCM